MYIINIQRGTTYFLERIFSFCPEGTFLDLYILNMHVAMKSSYDRSGSRVGKQSHYIQCCFVV